MVTKEDVIQYLKNNREDIQDICEEFHLAFSYENRGAMMRMYNALKDARDNYRKEMLENDDAERKEFAEDLYYRFANKVSDMEKQYHIFEPTPQNNFWLKKPESDEIFNYRKELFGTQSIEYDFLIDCIISEDMGKLWNIKGGQDGMYEAFPIVHSFSDERECYSRRCTVNRSYFLSSSGGIAIFEVVYHHKRDDGTEYDSSVIQALTLGEDDGYHFLNSANVYEQYCGDSSEFLLALEVLIKEFRTKFPSTSKVVSRTLERLQAVDFTNE